MQTKLSLTLLVLEGYDLDVAVEFGWVGKFLSGLSPPHSGRGSS